MQSANTGLIYGPIWLSKGERFRPSGAYAFLAMRYREYQILLKKKRAVFREVMFVIRSRKKPGESGALERDSSLERTEDDEPKIRETASIKNKNLLSLNTREIDEYRAVHWSKVSFVSKRLVVSDVGNRNQRNSNTNGVVHKSNEGTWRGETNWRSMSSSLLDRASLGLFR